MSLLSRSSPVLRQGLKRSMNRTSTQTVRRMGGGGHPPLTISEVHTNWGEAFGVITWLWVFHRARYDGPVLLGWRHPWEHGDGDHGGGQHHDVSPAAGAVEEGWDAFSTKALKMNDDDDDDDDEEEDEEEDDDE